MMTQIQNVSRRSFLKKLGVSSSALVIGVQFPTLLNMPKAFAAEQEKGIFQPSVYLQIRQDNSIGIIVHRSEMGQGIRTSIPMIVADELEADWQQIEVIQGLGDKKYGSQNTDGSRSVRNFYQPLRQAGATARLMLEQAAANIWDINVADCYSKSGQVIAKTSGKKFNYGELVAEASKLPTPEVGTIKLKENKDFKFIGKSDVALVDGKDIVTGNTTYGIDANIEGMKIAVIARPPVLAAKVVSFNADKAKAIKGVIDVVAMKDLEEPALFKPLGGIAIIANNTWAALKGREALEIEWSDSEHGNYNSKEYKQALIKSCENPVKTLRKKGDVIAALKAADKTISASYYVPELIHVPMEAPAAAAKFENGTFDIWACTQTPQSAQGNVAQATGVAPEKVNINVTLLGGGFGRKSKPDFIVEAAILAKQLNMPIKVVWTREDDIQNGYYHAVSYQKLTAGINDNRQVTAWQHNVAEPTISSTFSKGADLIGFEGMLGLIDMPFNINNVECAAGKATAHTRIGWLRSVTNINHAFAVSSFVDEIAAANNMDSKDHLLMLLGKDRHIDLKEQNANYGNYGESLDTFPIDIARLKDVVKDVAKNAHWGATLPKGHGMGIAVHRSFVSYVACVVEVSTNSAGKIKLENIWMSVDCGTAVNPERIKSQMEGAAVFGTSIAFFGEVTANEGVIEQNNFDGYQVARMTDIPPTHVNIIHRNAPPGGVGEPGVPPIAPAICNAIFNATGKRYRELPLNQYDII